MAALIIDDEPLARRGVRQLLLPHANIEIRGECDTAGAAVRWMQTEGIDVVFLDIRMPGMDGIEFARRVEGSDAPIIVFTTAHRDFAPEAFEVRAADYLIKPLSPDRFDVAIERVREAHRRNLAAGLVLRAAEALGADLAVQSAERTADRRPTDPRLSLDVDGRTVLVEAGRIDWIQANDYYGPYISAASVIWCASH